MSDNTFRRIAFVCLWMTYAVMLEIGFHIVGLRPGAGVYFAFVIAATTVYRRQPTTFRTG